MPTEGEKLSGAYQKVGTVYGHNSGESLKWAPKVQRCLLKFRNVLISQASGQSKAYVMALLPIICH